MRSTADDLAEPLRDVDDLDVGDHVRGAVPEGAGRGGRTGAASLWGVTETVNAGLALGPAGL